MRADARALAGAEAGAAPHPDLEAYLACLGQDQPFEAHEALEAAWRRAGDPFERADAAQALIQVAAAYVHRARGNAPGACRLAARSAERLARPCPAAAERALRAASIDRRALAGRLAALAAEPARWPPPLALVAPARCP